MQAQTSPSGWQRRLSEASSPEDVVGIANEFLAQWSQEELAQLPVDCAPAAMVDAGQLTDYALKLAHRHTIGSGDLSAMHRMATFFTKAALRVYKIDEIVGAMRDREEVERPRPRGDA
jgi:hypothetical protein